MCDFSLLNLKDIFFFTLNEKCQYWNEAASFTSDFGLISKKETIRNSGVKNNDFIWKLYLQFIWVSWKSWAILKEFWAKMVHCAVQGAWCVPWFTFWDDAIWMKTYLLGYIYATYSTEFGILGRKLIWPRGHLIFYFPLCLKESKVLSDIVCVVPRMLWWNQNMDFK